MKRILFLIIASIFACSTQILAQQPFTAVAPKVVEVGEQFRLSYQLQERGSDLELDIDSSFQLLMGPSTSSSYSTQIINGKRTTNSSFTYTYILIASKAGKFTIKPASISIKGKTIHSKAINIEVVKARNRNSQQSTVNQSNNNKQRSRTSTNINRDDIFVKVSLSKQSSYLGEHIVATLKVFTKLDLAGFGEVKFPSFKGFLSQEIAQEGQISLTRTNVNGEIYNVGIIRKLLLFPQHTGIINIDPFEMECIVRQRVSRGRRGGFFDDFFDNYKSVKIPCKSKATRVNIKKLPNTNIANYGGAVGNFTMHTSISKNELNVNDAISLKVKITGNGNLKLLRGPVFNFPSDFEVYDPTRDQNIKKSIQGTTGSVNIKYLIIPRHKGDFTIPSTNFCFFDTKTKTYKNLKTPAYKIKVNQGDSPLQTEIISNAYNKEDVRFIGKDIRYIKTQSTELGSKGSIFFASNKFYLAYLLPLFLFIALFILNRKVIKENSDIIKQKNKKASKQAKKRLKIAQIKLKEQNKEEFYQEISKAVFTYISDKLNISLGQLSKDNISNLLNKKQVEKQYIDELISILDICEYARYAPNSGSEEMGELFDRTKEIINKIESFIKK